MKHDRRLLFILRRALWYGSATAADVMDAFAVSRRRAVLDLDDAVSRWGINEGGAVRKVLLRDRGRAQVLPLQPKRYPAAASPSVMFEMLSRQCSFAECGLHPEEIDVIVRRRINNIREEVVAAVLETMLRRQQRGWANRVALRMRYVGMKLRDHYRERDVVPLRLEFEGLQTRLHAIDLNDETPSTKVFAMARIESAQMIERKIPPQVLQAPPRDEYVRLSLVWDPRLTPDQRQALLREINAQPDGTLRMRASDLHSFRSFYTAQTAAGAGSHIVWPPILMYEPLED